MTRQPRPVADALILAQRKGPSHFRMMLATVPLGDLPGVIEALAGRVNDRPPTRIIPPRWSHDDAKKAHAAFTRGDRDDWSIAGHRAYDAARKRRGRAMIQMEGAA